MCPAALLRHMPPWLGGAMQPQHRLTSASSSSPSVAACSTARCAAGMCTPSTAAWLASQHRHDSASSVRFSMLARWSAAEAASNRPMAAGANFSGDCAGRLGSCRPPAGTGSWGEKQGVRGNGYGGWVCRATGWAGPCPESGREGCERMRIRHIEQQQLTLPAGSISTPAHSTAQPASTARRQAEAQRAQGSLPPSGPAAAQGQLHAHPP